VADEAEALLLSREVMESVVDELYREDLSDESHAFTRLADDLVDARGEGELEEILLSLAEELRNTELLRGDFINNFSHEFKTPIVSIAGFARLLRRGNLPEEDKEQYLAAIEEESVRLAYMATNVLNLTRVVNQTILTDVTTFNLSEQLRSCLLLLEGKWSKKDIDLDIDLEEHTVSASEELLKQVWINLIDNAIKFTHRLGTVIMDVTEGGDTVTVAVSNTGVEIPPERMDKIFNKFYQADESHATEGNGIGLAIVKRVVGLHRGHITVTSERGMTTFRVALPKKNK
jgi:signal transduction histidine kinase